MKKGHVEFKKRCMTAFGSMEAKILQNVEDKIQEDESWASVVRRNVDKKLLHVKDDSENIKSSIEEAKIRMKETKEFIKDEKDKEIRRNNVIIYKVVM